MNKRIAEAERAVRNSSNPFEKIEALNQREYKPETLKYGSAKTPVEWMDFLFDSLEDAQEIYNSRYGAVRKLWDRIRGRKPWMLAYLAVKIGYPYEAMLSGGNMIKA